MAGRPKAKLDRESVLIWIVTRDLDLLRDAKRISKRKGKRVSASLWAIIELALKTSYPRDRKTANLDIPSALQAGQLELARSGIEPDTDGFFERGVVMKRWRPERRKWEKGYFTERAGTPSFKDYLSFVIQEPPQDWPSIRAYFELQQDEASGRETQIAKTASPSSEQKRRLNAAIRRALPATRRDYHAGLIDLDEYRRRRKNLLAWRRSRKGGSIRLE